MPEEDRKRSREGTPDEEELNRRRLKRRRLQEQASQEYHARKAQQRSREGTPREARGGSREGTPRDGGRHDDRRAPSMHRRSEQGGGHQRMDQRPSRMRGEAAAQRERVSKARSTEREPPYVPEHAAAAERKSERRSEVPARDKWPFDEGRILVCR